MSHVPAPSAACRRAPASSSTARSTVPRAAKFDRTPVTVDATGRFAYRVPTGPSRTLRFAQRVPGSLTYACSAPLKINVKASATLKATPRTIRSGQRVRFTGTLKGGYVPKGGKLIELQAYERSRWRSITTLRTNSKGAFSYRFALALLVPAVARAGTYEVWSCAGPDGAPVPADGWRPETFGILRRGS